MTLTAQILAEIEAFMVKHALPPSVFGELSCGDRHVIRNLRSGKSITLRRADQIRAFMAQYRPDKPSRRARGNGPRRSEARAA